MLLTIVSLYSGMIDMVSLLVKGDDDERRLKVRF